MHQYIQAADDTSSPVTLPWSNGGLRHPCADTACGCKMSSAVHLSMRWGVLGNTTTNACELAGEDRIAQSHHLPAAEPQFRRSHSIIAAAFPPPPAERQAFIGEHGGPGVSNVQCCGVRTRRLAGKWAEAQSLRSVQCRLNAGFARADGWHKVHAWVADAEVAVALPAPALLQPAAWPSAPQPALPGELQTAFFLPYIRCCSLPAIFFLLFLPSWSRSHIVIPCAVLQNRHS